MAAALVHPPPHHLNLALLILPWCLLRSLPNTISKFWTLLFPLLWSLCWTSSPFTNLLPFLSIHSCLCHRTLPPPGNLSHQYPSGCLCQARGTISSPTSCQGRQSTSMPLLGGRTNVLPPTHLDSPLPIHKWHALCHCDMRESTSQSKAWSRKAAASQHDQAILRGEGSNPQAPEQKRAKSTTEPPMWLIMLVCFVVWLVGWLVVPHQAVAEVSKIGNL